MSEIGDEAVERMRQTIIDHLGLVIDAPILKDAIDSGDLVPREWLKEEQSAHAQSIQRTERAEAQLADERAQTQHWLDRWKEVCEQIRQRDERIAELRSRLFKLAASLATSQVGPGEEMSPREARHRVNEQDRKLRESAIEARKMADALTAAPASGNKPLSEMTAHEPTVAMTPRTTYDPWETGELGQSEEHVRVCKDDSVYQAVYRATAGERDAVYAVPEDETVGGRQCFTLHDHPPMGADFVKLYRSDQPDTDVGEILAPALRQYRRQREDEYVCAYDYEHTREIVRRLTRERDDQQGTDAVEALQKVNDLQSRLEHMIRNDDLRVISAIYDDLAAIRRHLARERVPKSVSDLPERWRRRAKARTGSRESEEADELDRALADSGQGDSDLNDPLQGNEDLKEAYRAACVRLRELGELSVPLFRPYNAPDGWVLVPKEPTDEQVCAGIRATGEQLDFGAIYRAMIAAAPKPGGR